MQTKISIVIPIYNCNIQLLERCLDSLEKLDKDCFEIILIDDGSKEAIEDQLKKRRKLNKDLILIRQENNGVSAARNKGIMIARGEWIVFCDQDDYIDAGKLNEFVQKDLKNAEFIFCDYYKNSSFSEKKIELEQLCYGKDYIRKLAASSNLYGTVWGKLFRKDVINRNEILFDTDLSHAEDSVFLLRYLLKVKDIKKEKAFYHYCANKDSAAKNVEKAIDRYLLSIERFDSIIQENHLPKEYSYCFCCINLLILLTNHVFCNKGNYKENCTDIQSLLEKGLIKDSLLGYNKKEIEIKNRFVLDLINLKLFYPVYLLIQLRRQMIF